MRTGRCSASAIARSGASSSAGAGRSTTGRVSGHSLRVGAVQSMRRRGASVPAIMQNFRWRDSRTAAGYLAVDDVGRDATATYFEDGGK